MVKMPYKLFGAPSLILSPFIVRSGNPWRHGRFYFVVCAVRFCYSGSASLLCVFRDVVQSTPMDKTPLSRFPISSKG